MKSMYQNLLKNKILVNIYTLCFKTVTCTSEKINIFKQKKTLNLNLYKINTTVILNGS